MASTKRKYKVITTSGTRYVTPINDSELIYKFKRNESKISFRKELETKLTFVNDSKTANDDFSFFYGYESDVSTRCEEITCEIYKVCNGADVLEFTGIIPLVSGEWDIDKCKVTLKIETKNDVYECIKENKKETNFPVSQFMPYFNSAPDIGCTYTVDDYDSDYINHYFGTINGVFGLYDTVVPAVFTPIYNVGEVVCVLSDGSKWRAVGNNVWVTVHGFDSTFIVSGGFNVYDEPISGLNHFLTTATLGIRGLFFLERTDPVNSSFFNIPYISFAVLCYAVVAELLVKCGREQNNTTEYLRSDFFDWNAKGDTPGYVASSITKIDTSLPDASFPDPEYRFIYLPRIPGINYVTGQSNHLTHLTYLPKSNANNISASEWEQPFEPLGDANSNKLSFEEIEKIWATEFDAFWFIDSDGCMRVEHRTWFNNNAVIYDSTTPDNQIWNVANRKFRFRTDLSPKKEIFKFSANRDILNGRLDTGNANKNNEILYEGVCVNNNNDNNEVEYVLDKVVTDVNAIDSKNQSLADKYDNNGIFMCTVGFSSPAYTGLDTSSSYYKSLTDATCEKETLLNTISPTLYENGHLQWANLIRRYLKENRVLTVGVNGAETITFSARTRRTKEQKDIILKYCCDLEMFNPNQGQVITELGTGDIDEATYNTKTEIIKITALHD